MAIKYNDLSKAEKHRAKSSYLSLMEDLASEGSEEDVLLYNKLKDDAAFLLKMIRTKSFNRDKDGYIFVNL